jgi:hypothetical protein
MTSVALAGVRFYDAGIWPAWRGLERYVTAGIPLENCPAIEEAAGRALDDPERYHMHTEYGDGSGVMWFGQDVFFYITACTGAFRQRLVFMHVWRETVCWHPMKATDLVRTCVHPVIIVSFRPG